jgi:hypothetical protein
MAPVPPAGLTSCRVPLDPSPARLGTLRRSDDALHDADVLRARVEEDGYLYIPGFFDRSEVLEARHSVLETLRNEGVLHPDRDWRDAVARPGLEMAFRPDLANGNPVVGQLLYSPRVMGLYDGLFGEASRHYDYTWLRAVAPGHYTEPHYDIVYMGRGTQRIMTAWVPMSDISYEMGGLIVLEGSHRLDELKGTYGTMDVDVVCSNQDDAMAMRHLGYHGYGALSGDPRSLAEAYGLRWLTSEFRMGDLLTFTMFTLHASTDNHGDRIRLSTDSRYQPAAEPADERWVGESPMGHGGKATRRMIC